MPSSRGSSRPRDWTCVSYVSCRQVLLPRAPPGKPLCSSKLRQSGLGQVWPRRLCGREDGSPGPVSQPGCWRGACLFYRRVRGERWKPEATGGLRSQTWEKVDRASCQDDKERHKQRLGRQSGSQGGRRNGTGSQVRAKWRLTGGELNLPGLDTQLGLSFTSTRPDNICIISSCWLDKAKPPQRQTGGIHGGGGGRAALCASIRRVIPWGGSISRWYLSEGHTQNWSNTNFLQNNPSYHRMLPWIYETGQVKSISI